MNLKFLFDLEWKHRTEDLSAVSLDRFCYFLVVFGRIHLDLQEDQLAVQTRNS